MSLNDINRILIVDDDPQSRQHAQHSLEYAGYNAVSAKDGRDGLSRARMSPPNLILLDYTMPDISGKEFLLQLLYRQENLHLQHTPVVLLTTYTNDLTARDDLLDLPSAGYLCRPFGHHELLNLVGSVLATNRIKERNRMLETEVRQSFNATVRMLITLLFAKDAVTGKHSNMVVDLAEAVAVQCDLPEEEITSIKLGALLHDIGKIGISESILHKPSRLTLKEEAEMRRHVEYGEQALAGMPHMEEVRQIIKHHHEWWNGSGYPTGLCGESISIGIRITSVVDAYDAMTSNRPYRQRLSQPAAIKRLRSAGGVQFDPLIVEKLVECLATYDVKSERSASLQFLEECAFPFGA